MTSDTVQSGLSDNSIGAVAYLTLIPAILFLAIAPYNRSSYVRFHAWQSVVLCVAAFFANFVVGLLLPFLLFLGPAGLLGLSWLVSVVFLLIALWCAVSALNGKRIKLPMIGEWAERQSNK